MFDLDKEVDAWCRSVHTNWWNRNARIAELKDHLYCEMARLREKGWSEEEAFSMATERTGNAEELRTEHSKNRTVMSALFETADKLIKNLEKRNGAMSPRKIAFLNIAIAIVFAAAILHTDYLLEGTPHNETVKYSLIALWFIPFSYLSAARRQEKWSIKSEYHCLKQKVSSLLNRI